MARTKTRSKSRSKTGKRVEKIMMTKVREGHHLSRHEREVDAITQHIVKKTKRKSRKKKSKKSKRSKKRRRR